METVLETSRILGQITGIYLIVTVLFGLFRRREIRRVVEKLRRSPLAIYVAGWIKTLLGLAVIFIHPVWSDWPVVVTLIALATLLEGLLYLFLPPPCTYRLWRRCVYSGWYWFFLVVMAIFGIYLIAIGFSL